MLPRALRSSSVLRPSSSLRCSALRQPSLWTLVCQGLLASALLAAPAHAEKVIWQYDDLPGDMNVLASGLAQHPKYVHPGFVKGEAFGQLYKPKAADYPVKILSVELVMAQAPSVSAIQTLDATIEIWNDDSTGAAPTSAAPLWSINTADFFNPGTGQPGTPIQGNTAMIYQFDWSKPENHPPPITSGNIRVMIRINDNSASLETMWGKLECSKTDLGIGIDLCGCQKLAAVSDTATTLGANLMHIVWPLGACSGNKQWKFVEQLTNDSGFTMKGDFILRLGVDGVPPPVDVDAGPSADVGTDTGGADTGGADAGSTDAGGPSDTGSVDVPPAPQAPVIDLVTPASAATDQMVKIDVIGKHFEAGATVKIGATAIKVDSVSATTISAIVLPGIAPGTYAVVVTNPNNQVGFKDSAFTITAATPDVAAEVSTDAGSQEDTAPAPDVAAETAAPQAALGLEAVTPECVSAATDTALTVLGTGFQPGMTIKLGSTELLAVDVAASGVKATALVPKGMAEGQYSLIVELPGGGTKALANAVRVGSCGPAVVSGGHASGCSAAPGGREGTAAGLVLALAGLGLLWRRRLA